jgi:hypothetical protein
LSYEINVEKWLNDIAKFGLSNVSFHNNEIQVISSSPLTMSKAIEYMYTRNILKASIIVKEKLPVFQIPIPAPLPPTPPTPPNPPPKEEENVRELIKRWTAVPILYTDKPSKEFVKKEVSDIGTIFNYITYMPKEEIRLKLQDNNVYFEVPVVKGHEGDLISLIK